MDQGAYIEGAVVIPAIASLEVNDLGIISSAKMEFSDRVTLVRTGSPLGATTLVRALAAVGGRNIPASLLPESPDRETTIAVSWWSPKMVIHPVSPTSIGSRDYREQIRLGEKRDCLSSGEDTLTKLYTQFQQVGSDQCVALDKEVLSPLASFHRAAAFRLIETSSCQVIAFLPASVLHDLPTTLRKSVRYEVVSDPADLHRSTLRPVTFE